MSAAITRSLRALAVRAGSAKRTPLRPLSFTRYIAASALLISCSPLLPSAGNTATPIDTDIGSRCPSSRKGSARPRRISSACATMRSRQASLSAGACASSSTVNLSPL